MLGIIIGQPVKVNMVRVGVQKDGVPYAMVKIVENENSQSRSKSYIKTWGTELDERIVAGCKAVLRKMDGVDLAHVKVGERYGKPEYRDEFYIRGAVWEYVEG